MIPIDKCPNCKKKLKRIPGKTTNCPLCNGRIYVRIRVKDRKKVLVDLKGVKKIDDEWIKYALQSDWFKILKIFGITEKDYMYVHDDLTKKFGFNPRHRDIFWNLFNRLLINYGRDEQKVKLIQKHMSKFLSEERRFGGKE